MTCRT